MNFQTLGLSPLLLNTLETIGYHTPTPIQEESILEVLKGRDLLACAQTGTGKTASFALPIIDILFHCRKRNRLPRAIILTPTRELAAQIDENIIKYAMHTTLRSIPLVGGEIVTTQERQLKRGGDLIIATPGRLIDMIERGRLILNDIKIVVIDEADRMLDMGFMPEVDRILDALPKQRQTLLFSATMAEEIRKISSKYQINPKYITITHVSKTAETIDQHMILINMADKQKTVQKLVDQYSHNNPTIVFCNRKKDVDSVAKFLSQEGYLAQPLHGDLSQHIRNEVLDHFKKGIVRILVTSDIAARGIDIQNIGLVINLDMPINPEDYVHRIGRTGRAGQSGMAITLFTHYEKLKLQRLERFIKQQIPLLEIDQPLNEHTISLPSFSQKPFMDKKDHKNQGEVLGFGDFTPAFMLKNLFF